MKTVFQRVKYLLESYPQLRDSDKQLMLKYWQEFDGIEDLNSEFVTKATSPETIGRNRRKVQEIYHHLKPSKEVKEFRNQWEAKIRNWALENKLEKQLNLNIYGN